MTADEVVIVGGGPNGLAAAVTLATAGVPVRVLEARDQVGGGARTAELTLPGLRHDVCSAVHPFGVASPYLSTLPLSEHGLTWRWPEVQLAHPLDHGPPGVLHRSVDDTADAFGPDRDRWRRLFGPVVDGFDQLVPELLGPVLHLPRHPLRLARFGLPAVLPMTVLGDWFATDRAAALLAGSAAHTIRPLSRPLTSAIGILLTAAGHAVGWPVAEGGSQSITDALAALLRAHGGSIETGVAIRSLADVGPARAVLFDTTPAAMAAIAGDHLPSRAQKAFRRYRHGSAAFKLDLAVEGGIPWRDDVCRHAGTVHLGGTLDEMARAEAEVHRGRPAERPFVLVSQPQVCDPTRSVGDVHPVWTYAHVPAGYTGDASGAILDQLERFAPGMRDRVVGQAAMTPGDLSTYNENYVGGDIATGANTLRQLVFRPQVTLDPYRVAPGLYLCSAAAPPGAGVHGMCGHLAAQRVLRDLRLAAPPR